MATAPGHFLLSLPFSGAAPAPAIRPYIVSRHSPAALSGAVPLLRLAGTPRLVQCEASSGGYNVQVVVGEDEPEDVLVRRFRIEVSRAGVVQESRRRRFFETKQEARKRKAREASRRNRRRWSGPRQDEQDSENAGSEKTEEDDNIDNWDMPENDNGFV